MSDTYMVTGAMGCIGAWTLYHLVKMGKRVISYDISQQRSRLNLLLTEAEQQAITFIHGDLTDSQNVAETVKAQSVTHIIHLGALQVPFCRANPIMGGKVNVVGTLNLFEAARQNDIGHVVYASSIAVYGPASDYPPGPIAHDAPFAPRTLYGAFKQNNEQTARIYHADYGLSSTTLRPYTVYGVGRDQGLTSDPTKAMLAAARGEAAHIAFGGTLQYQLASDVAQQFIYAAEHPTEGAAGYNLGGPVVDMSEVVAAIEAIKPGSNITYDAATVLPFPQQFDDAALRANMGHIYETPLQEGIAQTITHFEQCLAKGRL